MKVIDVLTANKIKVLFFENELPSGTWMNVAIDGIVYQVTPVYGLRKCLAIEAEGDFLGKYVEFV